MLLWDLLHGLMLPSGNDAAHCLASYFGTILAKKTHRYFDMEPLGFVSGKDLPASNAEPPEEGAAPAPAPPPPTPWTEELEAFLMEMNMRARQIGLDNTRFNSPHGLSNPTNTSTAFDLAKLTRHCMKHTKFREIVRTRTY